MEQLYIPVIVPDLKQAQAGLIECLPSDYKEKTTAFAFNVERSLLLNKCPGLIKWIEENSIIDVLHYRIYVTPPHSKLPPHIDGGGGKPIVPFRLNIPIVGTENTKLTFYKTTADNLQAFVPESYLSSLHPKEYKRLKIIDSIEINTPHFINTAVLHGVNNTNKKYRAMFAVTWQIDNNLYRNVNEAFKINDWV